MNNLNDMALFSKVAELSGISAAARALSMPKSKVSRRVAALEGELGVRLLERTTRAVRLTEAGEIYYRHCRRVVEEVESAKESLNRMLEAPRGPLRVSASVAIGQFLLAPHIGEFVARYPEVVIDVNLTNRRVDVIAEGYDVAVRVGELQDSTLVSKRLGSAHAMLFASPGYIERNGALRAIGDLRKHRCLAMSDSARPDQWTLAGPRNRRETVSIEPYATANDLTTIRQIAVDGGGIVLLPGYVAEPAERSGHLCRVLRSWRTPPINYYVLYPSRRGVTLKLRAWLDFLSAKFGRSAPA